jgi:phosphonoacetaldehyde hydrolase
MYQDFIPLQISVLADYADLIPGTRSTVDDLRRRGMKIGSSTGYSAEMMDVLLPEAKRRGYQPDCVVCATDVPAGRPEPWMCFQNAMRLRVFPAEAVVKVGDTIPDIEEGLNAGMWTIGTAKAGNEVGLRESELGKLDPQVRQIRIDRACRRLAQAGAHYVVDTVADVPAVIDQINARLARGERP